MNKKHLHTQYSILISSTGTDALVMSMVVKFVATSKSGKTDHLQVINGKKINLKIQKLLNCSVHLTARYFKGIQMGIKGLPGIV